MREDFNAAPICLILAVLALAAYELGRLDGREDERVRQRHELSADDVERVRGVSSTTVTSDGWRVTQTFRKLNDSTWTEEQRAVAREIRQGREDYEHARGYVK